MRASLILFVVLCSIAVFLSSGCKKNEPPFPEEESEYLIFGWFYVLCYGESCIEVFKLAGNSLYEDLNDKFPPGHEFYNGNFKRLPDDAYLKVRDLPQYFPEKLWDESKNILGTPNVGDQGGLYIEALKDGRRQFWIIDQWKHTVPSDYHAFMDKVNEKILLLQ
jgi:hypothetical protein